MLGCGAIHFSTMKLPEMTPQISQQPPRVNSASAKGRAYKPRPSHAAILTGLILRRSLITTAVMSAEESTSCRFSLTSGPFCFLFANIPWAPREGGVIQISHLWLSAPQTVILYILPTCEYVLNTIHCTKKFFWRGLRAALIGEWREVRSQGSLVLCSFSGIMVVDILLGPRTPQSWVLFQIYRTRKSLFLWRN